jgi:hypothetical protein
MAGRCELAFATLVAATSFLLPEIAPKVLAKTLLNDLAFGYFSILLGCVSMWLCVRARRKAVHKILVTVYAVVLSPFAFSLPAWMLFVWFMYASGRYNGPMP